MPKLGRSFQGTADPDRDALDSVLVPVHPGHRLAPSFAQAVEPVGAKSGIDGELVRDRVHAESVVRARKHDALDPVPTGTLIDLVEGPQVVFDDLRKRT